MTATLDSEVAAGSLSSTDATALTRALSAIDSSLSTDGAGAAQPRLDPASTKDRIDGLIADQVSGGSLTSDQAGALRNLFASHGRSTGASDATGDVAGVGGPPPGPPPSGPSPSDAASGPSPGGGASGGGASGGTAGSSSASDLLATFIQQLQAAQASSAGYAASGASATTQASALLFDFQS